MKPIKGMGNSQTNEQFNENNIKVLKYFTEMLQMKNNY